MRKRLEVNDQEIIRLYNEGKSTFDIEKLLGVSRGAIRYRLKCNGITCRPRAKVELNDIKSKEGTPEFDYLATFGITERKSLTLKLKYINWNVLLGIFDGDGSLTKDARCFNFRFS